MNHPLKTTSRPQLALQSYLDALLQDATEEPLSEVVESPEALDEFQAAVLEEQASTNTGEGGGRPLLLRDGRVVATYASPSAPNAQTRSPDQVLHPGETDGSFDLARDLRQPIYSRPLPAEPDQSVLMLQVPLSEQGRFGGVVMGEYLVDGLLRFGIPPEVMARYAVALLDDYDASLRALLDDIDAATQQVHLLYYLMFDDPVGDAVATALCRASARGVACRLLLDAVGAKRGLRAYTARLRAAGVEVHAMLPGGLQWRLRPGLAGAWPALRLGLSLPCCASTALQLATHPSASGWRVVGQHSRSSSLRSMEVGARSVIRSGG